VPLTPKQQRFVDEYLVDLNATQAAIRAGYAKSGASVEGCRLLANASIRGEIEAKRRVMAEATEVDAQWVTNRLKELAVRSMEGAPVYDREGNPTGVWRCDGPTATKALDLLGKRLGIWVEKHEHTGKDGAPLVDLPALRTIIEQSQEST
jgi:phage terminase small subunit